MKDQTILIVDDDSSVRQLAGNLLRNEGFKVSMALNANNGLALLRSLKTPDLILVDLVMPAMDGIQFIQQLRSIAQYKDLPVILMTAEKNPDFLVEVETLKLAGLMLKPLDEKKLIEKVNKILMNEKT